MRSRDLLLSLGAAFTISIFLIPTLSNTGYLAKIPYVYPMLFVGFPIVVVLGMFIARILGRVIGILWQLAKYALVGVINTAIDFGILNFLIAITSITSGPLIILINAVAFSLAVINSYFWNKEWVFPGSKKASFVTFLIVSIIGIGINTFIVYFLTTNVSPVFVKSAALWANLAKILATGASLIWNFLGYRLVVFTGTKAKATA